MEAFTLRLEPALAKQLDRICRSEGYTKTGLVKALIREFLGKRNRRSAGPLSRAGTSSRLNKLVRIVNLGGDAVKDSEAYFE